MKLKHLARSVLSPLVRALRPRRVDLPLSTWRLTRTDDGVLSRGGVRLDGLLDRWGSPLHVVDATRLSENAAAFLARPAGAERAAEITYSFKTNPVPGVLRRLRDAGIGAEVISPYELWLALELGFDPGAIVYNGPAKSEASLRLAVERGVGLVNLNCRSEIAPFAAIARSTRRRPRVGVRVVVPGAWGGQLGERIDTGAALRAFTEVWRCPDLHLVALHAHKGGEIASAAELGAFVDSVLAFAEVLHERLGLDLEVIDLGGSLACPTVRHTSALEIRLNTMFGADLVPRAPGSVLGIREAVALVVTGVEGHYRARGRRAPRVILEPGRALTGDAQMLLARVVDVQDEVSGVRHAVLDVGICAASPVPNEVHQLFLVGPPRHDRLESYRLTGPICSPADVLYPSWRLPGLWRGDAVAIMDSGAYFVPFAASFSFPRPGIVMIDRGRDVLLRRAETFADIAALDDLARGSLAPPPRSVQRTVP